MAAIRSLKIAARRVLQALEDDTIVVSELRCTEPGCPPLETIVAVLRVGTAPRQFKIHKSVLDVTEADLRAASPLPETP